MRWCGLGSKGLFVFSLIAVLLSGVVDAASVTWIGGNVDWVDGIGNDANWSPSDEPDADDTAIFNTANAVHLGSNNAVNGLTMSGGIDLFTNEFALNVDGLVQLSGAGTNLFLDGAAGSINADNVTINADGVLELRGGTLTLDEESGTSLLDINAGGNLQGNGVITFADAPIAATTLLVNDGEITALSRGLLVFSPPPVGTLTINDSSVGGRVDLDGASEAGVVSVNRNQTLDLNVPLADSFNGTLNLFHHSTFDSASAWTLAGGAINVDNGFVDGTLPFPDIAPDTSFLQGGTLTQSGGTITVVDTDGTLQFDNVFNMTGGTFVNQGHVIFNKNATINNPAVFTMGPSGADLTVGANADVVIHQTSFNLDGTAAGTEITVDTGGTLNLDLGDYDNDAATNAFDATINLNGGALTVNTADAAFVMDGTLNMHSTSFGIAFWNGETLDIGNDAGALDADLNVTGESFADAQFGASVDFNSDADVNIAAGGTLAFVTSSTVNFNTVNGANHAEFTGSGSIEFSGAVNVNEAVTLDLPGGNVDLDGFDATGELINIDAPLTVNAATFADFGRFNSSGGTNTLDINNSVGTGVLTVNLDDPNAEWTLNALGDLLLVNDNTAATLLAGSDVNLNGQVGVTGDVRVTARVDIGSIVQINTVNEPLRLAGGNNTTDPNTIAGGTIFGAGLIGADDGKALHGFGTINLGVDFDGTASLRADNGTLTVSGTILDVGTIGTADTDGVLDVTNAWNTNVAIAVVLNGGTLQGGTITNDVTNGIQGFGIVTSRVINNSKLLAGGGPPGSSLVFETAGNDNDWDGAANTGQLAAAVGGTLELRDVGPAFGFGGSVVVGSNSRVLANGFALDFNPGSSLSLTNGTYESTSSTDLGGTVTVSPGAASTIKVQNNSFLTFETGSASTLNGDLRLENNNINIEAGAAFGGTGAIVIPDGSHLVADANANIGVLVDNQGAFRPANFDAVGRVDVKDFQQGSTGELFTEIQGTALNAFDRIVVNGDAVIDGYLNIDIDGSFVPALGQTFNIITGNSVSGQFDYYDVSGMPAGLTFHVKYQLNAVQLEVVNKETFAADFDDDGDVDLTDYAIWKGAFNLNQLGDATGDNISNAADYTVWRDQLGSVSDGIPGSGAQGFAAVPEPGTAALLLIAVSVGLAATRKQR